MVAAGVRARSRGSGLADHPDQRHGRLMTGPYVLALRARELFADPAYQRDAQAKRVARMAAEFDQRLVGVLEVSKRPDSRFAILDGQHRHAAVLQVQGADALLVCQVYEGLTEQDEARLFREINARRKAL